MVNYEVDIKQRADFLSGLVMRKFPFRLHWPTEARYMLSYGMSASRILRTFEANYRPGLAVYSQPLYPIYPAVAPF